MTDLVRLVVDSESCIGSGVCEMLEEATFEIDEDTFIARTVGTGMLTPERAAAVIDQCPASAISLQHSVSDTECCTSDNDA